jgi:PKD repeat protein
VTNQSPSADAGGPYTGTEGSPIQLDGSGSSDPDGTIATYQWSLGTFTNPDGGTCSFVGGISTGVSPSVICNDNGTLTVSLTVTDDDGATDSDEATVTVANVAPVLTSLSLPVDPVPVNTTVNLSGAFTDDGSNDTHTATIDWDDGVNEAGTVTQGSGSGSVSQSHTYTTPGIYAVRLTVTDDDGDSDAEIFQYVVVYDPSAGFVTGGGWINSPAGAYAADPDLTGKATFGFVSKYQKGATVPTGNTEFQFHAGSLNFKSTSYDWLVVQGSSSKATYKGYGTVNGAAGYGFLLSAIDGSPDKFRIKIWQTGGAVIYDNGSGGDNADPTTEIAGGSIVIHVPKK